ncbi:hypothetical protein PG990_015037 [Apiospora arundinis]
MDGLKSIKLISQEVVFSALVTPNPAESLQDLPVHFGADLVEHWLQLERQFSSSRINHIRAAMKQPYL